MLVITMYPAIRVLRLADRNTAGMDKIYFATQKCSQLLDKYATDLEKALLQFEHHDDDGTLHDEIPDDDSSCEDASASDDEEDDSVDDNSDLFSTRISDVIISRWNIRKQKLEHDFAIVGWMCSVVPEIYDSCSDATLKKEHHDAFERVARKLLSFTDKKPKVVEHMVKEAIKAHGLFRRKEGYYSKSFLWTDEYIDQQKSHKWHQAYSALYYDAFTLVACRVTSKILGIGSAERAWGDVKHLKNGKRSHLGHENTEKASIVYGQACLRNRSIQRELKPDIWSFDDLDDAKLMASLTEYLQPAAVTTNCVDSDDDSMDDSNQEKPSGLFVTQFVDDREKVKAYVEPIERTTYLKKQHDDHFYHLNRKYGGKRYIDPDTRRGYIIETVQWYVPPHSKSSKGCYCVLGVEKNCKNPKNPHYDRVEINDECLLQIRICEQDPIYMLVDEQELEVNRHEEIDDHFYHNHSLIDFLKQSWEKIK